MEFFYWKVRDDRLQASCKNCAGKVCKAWRLKNPERVSRLIREWGKRNPDKLRDIWLRADHGISKVEYDAIFAKQRGVCAICRKREPTKKALAVDHNHATGILRGLLCSLCNRGMGHFRDDIQLLARAIEYLATHALNDQAKKNATA